MIKILNVKSRKTKKMTLERFSRNPYDIPERIRDDFNRRWASAPNSLINFLKRRPEVAEFTIDFLSGLLDLETTIVPRLMEQLRNFTAFADKRGPGYKLINRVSAIEELNLILLNSASKREPELSPSKTAVLQFISNLPAEATFNSDEVAQATGLKKNLVIRALTSLLQDKPAFKFIQTTHTGRGPQTKTTSFYQKL